MGLTNEERDNIVKFRLNKAKETFAEIAVLIENKFYRTAANRLYYACYHAATALLIKDGYQTHTHNGVKTMLGLHYIQENLIDKSLGKIYGVLSNLRQESDYEDWISIDENDVMPLVEPAERFIETIEKLLLTN